MFRRLLALTTLATITACVTAQYDFNGGDASTGTGTDAGGDSEVAPHPPPGMDGGIDAEPPPPPPHEAGVDAPMTPMDAGDGGAVDANEAGTVRSWLIGAAASGNSSGVDPGMPWEKDTISITRSSTTAKLYLAANAEGTENLYVDDNIHIIVAKPGGAQVDQYYEFWDGYPCPAASTTPPPAGYMSGWSIPIEVTSMFAADTTNAQSITVEFWHCAPHGPSHHAFYLVEK